MMFEQVPAAALQPNVLLQFMLQSPNGVALTDCAGRLVMWNRALEHITGMPASAVSGQYVWDVQIGLMPQDTRTPESEALTRSMMQSLLQQGSAEWAGRVSEYWIARPDGGRRLVEAGVYAIQSEDGYQIASVLRDITEAYSNLNRIRVLTQAVEHSPLTVVITDSEGRIEYGNQRLCELTGYTLPEVIGQSMSLFKSGQTTDETYQELWQTIRTGEAWHGEILNRKKNGELFWEYMSVSPVTSEDGSIQHYVAIKEDVTERRRTQQELEEREQRFRSTFEQAAVGLSHVTPDGRFIRVNQRLCDMTGYTREELLRLTFRDITYPPDLQDDLDHAERILRGEISTYTLEKRYVRKDGSLLWVELTVSLTFHEDGTPKYFISVIQDISARKAAQQALETSEYNLRRSQAVAHVGHWTWDVERDSVQWSDEMHRIFGLDRAHFTGSLHHVIEQSIHPDDRDQVNQANLRVAEAQQPATIEYRVVWPDGSVHHIWAQPGDHVRDEHGRILQLSGVAQDITQRKQAELALQQANAELDRLNEAIRQHNAQLEQIVEERTAQLSRLNDRMATILDNTNDAIILLNADAMIENTNVAFDRLFGYERDEIFEAQIGIVASPEDAGELLAAIDRARAHRENQRLQITARKKDGRFFDADIALAYVRDNHDHIVCSVRDITPLKEIDRAKDAFISMVSHELRTPVSAIMLSAETMQRYYPRMSDAQIVQKIEHIHQQAANLTELVTAVLDVTRLDARHRPAVTAPVDLARTLVEVGAELLPAAEAAHQTLAITPHTAPLPVLCEHTDLTRIWRNLISNAIKYAGDSSTIQAGLRHSEQPLPAPVAALRGRLPADIGTRPYALGFVCDNGPGIHETDLPQLCTRFFRGRAAGTGIPGTGLGLSLVKGLVQGYGGDIVVYSEPYVHTVFCFWLPLNGPAAV